jgi:hypothetical protein
VCVQQHGSPTASRLFVNLHEDERTSVEAAHQLLAERSFRLHHFDAGGDRRIRFDLAGASYEFDPNRIFSRAGVEGTLRRHNTEVTAEACEALMRFTQTYVRALAIDGARSLVALHNTEGNFSIHAFEAGARCAVVADEVHVDGSRHRHDFFYVTNRPIFEALRARGYNAVLQARVDQLEDDGSLSVYCGRRGIPYVNVEARHNEVENQAAMLGELWGVLDDSGL